MPHHPPAKTLFIQTYGCQMNVYDSGRMADVLANAGYGMVASAAEADVVILNTCHIREKAAEKVYSEIGRLRSILARPASDGGRRILAIAGCVAQAEGEELLSRAPAVDLVVGPQSYHRLADMVDRVRGGESGVIDTEFPAASKFDDLPESRATTSPGVAYLTVQEGCDRFCTFCVVPYTRGAEYSRPVADVLAEAVRDVDLGAREIILLGQNVNAYHGVAPDKNVWRLAQLIAALAALPGVERVRYTTSHPADMTDDLIAAHRDIPALMPFLHLPIQSGSDRILAAMNRRHVADDYRRIVERLRRSRSDLALSSDFIVGFPGETDDDFRDTLALIEDIGFSQAYSFKYSPRPGTPAAEAPQLDEVIKSERLLVLQELLDRQKQAFNRACIGQTQPVLFDRRGRNDGQLVGRGPYMQAVHANAPDDTLGRICEVAIEHAGPNSLSGRLLGGVSV